MTKVKNNVELAEMIIAHFGYADDQHSTIVDAAREVLASEDLPDVETLTDSKILSAIETAQGAVSSIQERNAGLTDEEYMEVNRRVKRDTDEWSGAQAVEPLTAASGIDAVRAVVDRAGKNIDDAQETVAKAIRRITGVDAENDKLEIELGNMGVALGLVEGQRNDLVKAGANLYSALKMALELAPDYEAPAYEALQIVGAKELWNKTIAKVMGGVSVPDSASNGEVMRVRITSYSQSFNTCECEVINSASPKFPVGRKLEIDPFCGLAVPLTDEEYEAGKGAECVGKVYEIPVTVKDRAPFTPGENQMREIKDGV